MAVGKATKGIVAHGRTVIVNGKPVAAGKPVTLSAEEIESLTDSGFLVDESAPEPEFASGPKLIGEGPGITKVA